MLIATTLKQWLPTGRLAKNTVVVMFWQGIRVVAQALWLVLIARALGPQGYGAFAGIAGLGNAVGGLAGLGLGLVMYRDVAQDPICFSERWSQTVVATTASGSLLAAGFVICSGSVLGYTDKVVIVGVAVSEIVCFPFVTAAAFAFAAHERMSLSAALPAMLASSRVIAVLAFLLLPNAKTLANYVWFHASATAVFVGISLLMVRILLRPAVAPIVFSWRQLCDGLAFSAVWMTGNALTSLDKALVLRLAGSEVAGLYASAYRFAMVLALPVDALVMAAMPRLFRQGGGVPSNPRLIRRLLLVTIAYGLLSGVSLWLIADLLPLLLGDRFVAATGAVKWMGIFLPFYGLCVLGGNLLMARGYRMLRLMVEGAGLASLVLFGIWLLPRFGLNGAVTMMIASEVLLCIATWALLLWMRIASGQAASAGGLS